MIDQFVQKESSDNVTETPSRRGTLMNQNHQDCGQKMYLAHNVKINEQKVKFEFGNE